jgi:hypothetical protein
VNERTLKILEFDKIVAKVETFAASRYGKEMVRDLKPFGTLSQVRASPLKPYVFIFNTTGFRWEEFLISVKRRNGPPLEESSPRRSYWKSARRSGLPG